MLFCYTPDHELHHAHPGTRIGRRTARRQARLRYEKGDFEGGFCVLRDQKLLVVNKRLPDAKKASSVAVGLSQYGIDETFLKPTLRQYIEDEAAKILKKR